MTFLAIDVGNTRLKWAMYASAQADAPILAQGAEFLENIGKLAEGAWAELPAPATLRPLFNSWPAQARRMSLDKPGMSMAGNTWLERRPRANWTFFKRQP